MVDLFKRNAAQQSAKHAKAPSTQMMPGEGQPNVKILRPDLISGVQRF